MLERRPVGRIVRVFALVLGLAAGITAACDSSTDATATDALDPGPTFGVEVTVSVSGNGRVVSTPGAIDCPSTCFTRITSADHAFDGSDLGMTLTATAGLGSHFVGWSAAPFVSGTRARGPAECSPMTRNALGPPIGPFDSTVVLPYGETQGTPPKGLEVECAPYTTVPVAFALVATFAEDPAQPFFGTDAAVPGEVLFEPPALGTLVAREIGLHGDLLYVRYDQDSTSSLIVSSPKDGKGALTTQITSTLYRAVTFGPNLIAQDQNLVVTSLNLTTLQRATQSFGEVCTALATDDTTAYCRWLLGGQSILYTWRLDGLSGVNYVYALPFGHDLAVDDASIYFSDVPSSGASNAGTLESAMKAPDANGFAPDASKLVPGVSGPSNLVATGTDLIWLDVDTQLDPTIVAHAPKTGADSATVTYVPASAGVAFAIDPTNAQVFYSATSATANGGASIYRHHTDTPAPPELVLSGMPSLNGLTVDETYLYWTEDDGRVYRAPK